MLDIDVTVRVRAALVAALAVCAACGGGGGGGGGGTAVGGGGGGGSPPAPTITVTARAVASATSVQEGQPFKLDASTSAASSGGALTYAWTQVSGPAVTISTPTSAVLDINAAEVTADTAAQFRVTATTGSTSASATVDVTFTNIAQTPVFLTLDLAANAMFNASYPASIATIFGNWTFGLVGTTPASGGPITFTQFDTMGPSGVQASSVSPFAETFSQPASFNLSQTRFTGGGTTMDYDRPWLTVAEETANRFRVFEKVAGGSYGSPIRDISITRPCTVEFGFQSSPPVVTMKTFVGQRQRGFTIVSDTGAVLQEINTPQSLCAMAVVTGPVNSTAGVFPGPRPALQDLLAIDTDANTVNHFAASGTDPTKYELKSQAALQLSSSSTSLKFVSATQLYSTTAAGARQQIAGLALVYSDGQHQGEHRLILVGLDSARVIRQDMRSWPLGVPSDVILDNIDGDRFPEIIVLSSTSPQAIVYEANNMFSPIIPIAVAGTPSFMEVGLGATKALPSLNDVLSLEGLFIAYRDKPQVKLFYPPS